MYVCGAAIESVQNNDLVHLLSFGIDSNAYPALPCLHLGRFTNNTSTLA